MVDVEITFCWIDENNKEDTVKITGEKGTLAEGKVAEKIRARVSEILDEFEVEFNSGQKASRVLFNMIPLLTENEFSLDLGREEGEYFLGGPGKITVKRVSLLDRNDFLTEKKVFKKDEALGIDLDLTGWGRKSLENLLQGVNSKRIQEEARQMAASYVNEGTTKEKQDFIEKISGALSKANSIIMVQQGESASLKVEIKGLKKELAKEREKNIQMSSEILQLKREIDSVNSQVLMTQENEKKISQLLNEIQSLKSSVLSLEAERENIRKSYEDLLSSFDSSIQSFQNFQITPTDSFKPPLSEDLVSELQEKIASLEREKSFLYTEVVSLRTDEQISKISIMQDPQVESFSFTPIVQVLKEREKISSQSTELNTLIQKLKDTQKKLEETEEALNNKESIINLIKITSAVSNTQQKIDQKPSFTEEFFKILQQLEEYKQISTFFEEFFYTNCSSFFKKINKLSSLNLNMHRLVEKFVKIIRDKDCQIYMLRHIARDAALERKVYIPVKTDVIDVCLAEYINNRKAPLQIPLIREDSGVYNFYTRTIKLKIENNKVIVRLGGGFEGIEEFLNINTQPELDKLEERRKFFCPESVKKFIEHDFQILGLPSVIDYFTPVTPLPEGPQGGLVDPGRPVSPKRQKRPSAIVKENVVKSLQKKKTIS